MTGKHLEQLAAHVDTVFMLRELDPPSYLYVSPSFEQLTGRSPNLLATDPDAALDMVHPLDRALADEHSRDSWAGKAAHAEFRFITADGRQRWVRIITTPIPVEGGAAERAVTSIEDITDRVHATRAAQAAEAAARAANEAKSLFLSRMSHELRTPLNAVIGFGQLLERRVQDPDDLSSVQYILQAGQHLLELIDEVLDISRIESGDLTLNLEAVDVEPLVREVVASVRSSVDASDVDLAVGPGPAGLAVRADAQRLRQVLHNLLSNAVTYNHPGGHVRVSWADTGRVGITITDDGPGVAPEIQHRLFTPFDRLGAEAGGVEGSGVGLAVTRALVEVMGGAVIFQSEPHVETTFTVDLAKASTAPEQPVTVRCDPATLLYVDDSQANLRVVESLLRLRPHWRLLHAGLGGPALQLAVEHRPDLVVLDQHLPDAFGLDVLAALKSEPATAAIPVAMVGAEDGELQRDRLLRAGAARCLSSPLDVMDMLNLLDDISTPETAAGSSARAAGTPANTPESCVR